MTRKNDVRLVRRQGKFSANPLFGGLCLHAVYRAPRIIRLFRDHDPT